MKNLLLKPSSETMQKIIKDRDSNKSWSTYQTYQLGKVWCLGLKPNRNSFLAIRKLRSLSQIPILSHSSKASGNPSSNQYSLVHYPHLTAHLSSLSNHQMQRRSFWWQILNNHCLSWSSKTTEAPWFIVAASRTMVNNWWINQTSKKSRRTLWIWLESAMTSPQIYQCTLLMKRKEACSCLPLKKVVRVNLLYDVLLQATHVS